MFQESTINISLICLRMKQEQVPVKASGSTGEETQAWIANTLSLIVFLSLQSQGIQFQTQGPLVHIHSVTVWTISLWYTFSLEASLETTIINKNRKQNKQANNNLALQRMGRENALPTLPKCYKFKKTSRKWQGQDFLNSKHQLLYSFCYYNFIKYLLNTIKYHR